MFHLKFSNKGFIFVLEIIIAFVIFASFLSIASTTSYQNNYAVSLSEKQMLSSVLSFVDNNGSIMMVLDDYALDANGKINEIENIFDNLIPQNFDYKFSLRELKADSENCKINPTFENCFSDSTIFLDGGLELPSNKSVTHERLYFLTKGAPEQCSVGAVFEGGLIPVPKELVTNFKNEKEFDKLFFSDYEKISFAGEEGADINFGVNVTPENSANCGDTIRVDLNAEVNAIGEAGRKPADILLLIDRSGSMGETTILHSTLNSGSFNNGTNERFWFFCYNYSNWQILQTIDVDQNLVSLGEFQIRMDYTGYSGSCSNPRLRIRTPSGTYLPDSTGSSSSNSIGVLVSSPQVGTYTIEGWSDESINYSLFIYKTKMPVAKESAKDFIDYSEWSEPNDHMGLVSFSTSATLNQSLLLASDTNKQIIKNQVDALVDNGSTAIGDAINLATNELTGPNSNDDAVKFQILLSDGENTTGSNPLTAANNAADNNIKIYTIGFGDDADEATLTQIANMTDAKYYSADDENALIEVFDFIAQDIGLDLIDENIFVAYDANIRIPIDTCDYFTDLGGGTCQEGIDGNYLFYDIGTLDGINSTWNDYFEMIIACNTTYACENEVLTFPQNGTLFFYFDENGVSQEPITWDINKVINFNYRDLEIEINNALISSRNLVTLDINAKNVGSLFTGATDLTFYLDDPVTGSQIKSKSVSALTSGSYEVFFEEEIEEEGWIYAVLNDSGAVLECPGNNTASIYCANAPVTKYYVLDLWVFRK